ncbi:MAG: hybrid sensor histidine kinase/response regulator [Deltaproteobacteria bacterium]|nr:hybrid sensor histidine kinase/response regulator [Deltaproteobacteria bacterium]
MRDPSSRSTVESGAPAIVLLVDDEPGVLTAMRRSLRSKPWKVLTAASGLDGLEILERQAVSVVISDFQMPAMDGVDFLKQVKERWPHVQRVMLTGNATIPAIEHVVNKGEVSRFLTKPWSDAQLKAVVTECLERVRLAELNALYEQQLTERNAELVELNQHLERQVAERTRALVQAEKMAWLGRMAGGVAHEINNPLGGILAFAQLLSRDGKLDESSRESVAAIRECALRCKTIVDDLLSFARRPGCMLTRSADFNDLILAAVHIAGLHPRAKDLELRVETCEGLPPVRCHTSLLQQVIVNLVQNAIDASEPGQIIRIAARREDGWLLADVEDRGCGIPEHVQPNVFEPFFTTKEVGQGTGLGLAICYRIVQEHGGRLDFSSREGQGSVFTVRVPVDQAAEIGGGT